jgi:hypothetical protein
MGGRSKDARPADGIQSDWCEPRLYHLRSMTGLAQPPRSANQAKTSTHLTLAISAPSINSISERRVILRCKPCSNKSSLLGRGWSGMGRSIEVGEGAFFVDGEMSVSMLRDDSVSAVESDAAADTSSLGISSSSSVCNDSPISKTSRACVC